MTEAKSSTRSGRESQAHDKSARRKPKMMQHVEKALDVEQI